MSAIIDNNINSAILSGQFGLQQASNGITQAASAIAHQTVQPNVTESDPQAVLANASVQGLEAIRDLLPSSGDDLTSNLLSLTQNSMNAQASAKVLDVANDTVGTIIDTLA